MPFATVTSRALLLACLCAAPCLAQEGSPAPQPQRRQAYFKFMEARRLGEDAQRLRSAKLLEDAIRAFRESIRLDPQAAEPHVDLGELYFFQQTRRDLAEREALEAVRLDPKSIGGNLLLARLYVSELKMESSPRPATVDRAVRQYEKVAELDPGQTEAWAILAELYQARNQADKRLQALEKWAGAPAPGDSFFYRWVMNSELAPEQAWYQLSGLYLERGRTAQAVDAARRAYEANTESADYARNLVGVLTAAGPAVDELRIYRQLIRSANSPPIALGFGSALVRAGRYREAIEQLREYIKVDPSSASAVGLLAVALRRSGQRPAAAEVLRSGLARAETGSRIDLQVTLAETYEELGRDDEAMTIYEQAFDSLLSRGALTPVNTPLFNEVATRLVRVCRRAGTQARLQSILNRTRRAIDEHNSVLDSIVIESLRDEGKRREALELTRASSRRNPEDRSLKLTEALILADLGRFAESQELLSNLISGLRETAAEDAAVHQLLSNVQLQLGDPVAAEASARRAVALNPDDPESSVQLASALHAAGKHDESEKILAELIARNPEFPVALNNYGYFLLERGVRFEEALAMIEKAVNLEPLNGSFLDSLGWAHFKLGRLEKARELIERSLLYSRRNATAHEHLGDVMRDLGRPNEARRHWEKALELSSATGEVARIKVKLKGGR